VWIWFSAAWSLSVVHMFRTKQRSSTTPERLGHQSEISMPLRPRGAKPTCIG
jgi:hypothetical protein